MVNKLSKVIRKPGGSKPRPKQKPVPVRIVSQAAQGSLKVDESWRARDALSTLARADEIKRDKPLMRAVKAEAKKQMNSLKGVCK